MRRICLYLVPETPQVRGRSRLQDLVPSLSPTSGDLRAVETCRVTEGTVVSLVPIQTNPPHHTPLAPIMPPDY